MNTTIIKANKEIRKQIMDVVLRKLNNSMRPVVTFNGMDEDTMVISGCTTSALASALPSRIGKRITWIHCC